MNNLIVSLDTGTLIISLIGGMLFIIGFLVSILWKNIYAQFSSIKQVSEVLAAKLDRRHNDIIKTIESIKLQQKEHDLVISSIKEHNSTINSQLALLTNDVYNLPKKVVDLINLK